MAADGQREGSSFEAAFRVFEAVCDLPAAELGPAVEAACGGDRALRDEVLALVASDRRASAGFEQVPPGAGELFAAPPAPELVHVAGYEIRGVLGSGGMGVVYEALQAAPRRTVALKLLRPGLVTAERLRRFELEAQALGWLDHPGIARIWASGRTEGAAGGQPWLAMELVRGERIDRWMAARALPAEARLELVARVCEAVHHAHQRGVVHRDLKPANILVDAQGRPKVLDFGLARITEADLEAGTRPGGRGDGAPAEGLEGPHTGTGQILGTLAYMSPEQLAGAPEAVDHQSDVYALGVLTYELLSGARPFELSGLALHEAARRVIEQEPERIGERDAAFAGDVELILAKAMAKEKERRYASAADLARDLRRHLAHEPVLARPASRSYRIARFARRNRLLVGVLAAVFLALSAGTLASTTLLFRARGEARRNQELLGRSQQEARVQEDLSERYRRESRTAGETAAFLEDVFAASSPYQRGIPTARELLDRSARRIQDEFRGDAAVRGRLLSVLGKAYLSLGFPARAEPMLVEAAQLLRAEYGEDSLETQRTLHRLANVRRTSGDQNESIGMLQGVLESYRRELGPESDEVATAMNDLANALGGVGRLAEATELYRESLRIHELHWGPGHRRTDPARVNLASALMALSRVEEAEAILREAVATASSEPARINALNPLGRCLMLQLRYAEAERTLREAVGLSGERYGEHSLVHRQARANLANVVVHAGRPMEVLEELFALAAEAEATEGPEAWTTLEALHDLASCLADTPMRDQAEALYRDVIERARRAGGNELLVLQTLHNLAFLYLDLGRLEEALESVRQAYEGRVQLLGEESPVAILSLRAWAMMLRRGGREEEALELRRRALAAARASFGEGGPVTQELRMETADLLRRLGRGEEAEAVLVAALEAERAGGTPTVPSAQAWLDQLRRAPEAARAPAGGDTDRDGPAADGRDDGERR